MILFFVFFLLWVCVFEYYLFACLYSCTFDWEMFLLCTPVAWNVRWKQHIISEQGISNLIRWANVSPKKYSFNGLILFTFTHTYARTRTLHALEWTHSSSSQQTNMCCVCVCLLHAPSTRSQSCCFFLSPSIFAIFGFYEIGFLGDANFNVFLNTHTLFSLPIGDGTWWWNHFSFLSTSSIYSLSQSTHLADLLNKIYNWKPKNKTTCTHTHIRAEKTPKKIG